MQQDVEPEPQPLLAGLRQQGDQAAGAPAGVLAESEVRAGLGLGPGPPAAAPGPSALALRAQLPGHGEPGGWARQARPARSRISLRGKTTFLTNFTIL